MNLFKNVDESWIPLLHSLAYKEPLVSFINSLRDISYQPGYNNIFKVFEMPVKDIKVVILGHEPSPRPGDAIGLAYATTGEGKIPVVLGNIHDEISKQFITKDGYVTDPGSLGHSFVNLADNTWKSLDHWVEQGVFLLNTTLTVETNRAASHIEHWNTFTDTVISFISAENPCVWMLWGGSNKVCGSKIKNPFLVKGYDRETLEEIPVDPNYNYVIPGDHPITLSMGREQFSNDGFYHTNRILEKKSLNKIIW
jgi:uracil-DNA glycosylase